MTRFFQLTVFFTFLALSFLPALIASHQPAAMKQLTYRLSPALSKDLSPVVRKATAKACRSWEKSGVVQFAEESDPTASVDFTLTLGALPSARVFYSPLRVATWDAAQQTIFLNSLIPWQTRWWHALTERRAVTPQLLGHEIGHVLGLPDNANEWSVMCKAPARGEFDLTMPSPVDFAALRRLMSPLTVAKQ